MDRYILTKIEYKLLIIFINRKQRKICKNLLFNLHIYGNLFPIYQHFYSHYTKYWRLIMNLSLSLKYKKIYLMN